MTRETDQFQRLDELFHLVEGLPEDQRRHILDRECADDPSLRGRVEDLLKAHGRSDHLDHVVDAGLGWLDQAPPERIGPYRLLKPIGQGGFATVFLAERDDGQFDKQVAIKIVHRHLNSPEVAQRFRRERQMLADFDHPNIARILDSGSTAADQPYVVMEYVEGRPIDQYCDEQGLGIEERLNLFQGVLDAVQTAHRSLVLHRDLKPSNILVTDDGVAKLLDFGIATWLRDEHAREGGNREKPGPPGRHRPDTSPLTRPGFRLLTPEFAGPEQILGRPLTTATDVYSLGVVMYLLVTGEMPYRLESDRWVEIERVVCEQTPPPARAVSRLSPGPSPDLETIVAKALAKEPERRYVSVEQLSEDLRRARLGMPISARKPSIRYVAGKFIARHRLGVATGAVVLLVLVAALMVVLWQAREAQLARSRAEHVADFLEQLFEVSDPYDTPGESMSAREVVERGAQRVRELRTDPRLGADLMATIGRVYRGLALYDEAEESLRVALENRRQVLGEHHPDVADTLRDLGMVHIDRGDCERARQDLEQALEAERQNGDELGRASTLHLMGQTEMACGGAEKAEGLIRQALVTRRKELGELDEATTDTASLLAELWYDRGEYDRAGQAFSEVLAQRRRALGDQHPKVAVSLSDLAAVKQANGDPSGAVPLYLEALATLRESFGERHGLVAQTLYNLATAHLAERRWQEAGDRLVETLSLAQDVYGDRHPLAASCLNALAGVRARQGRPLEARSLYLQALDTRRKLLGPDHPTVAQTMFSLAGLLKADAPDQALELYTETLELQERIFPPDDFRFAYTYIGLGDVHLGQGAPTRAEPFFRQAVETRRRALPEGHWEIAIAQAYLGRSLGDQGRLEEAEAVLTSSLELLIAALGPDDPRTRRAESRLQRLRARRSTDG